jgi:hypothetical protein
MEFPILICLTFLLLHLHFPTLLGTSAKATAVCLFLEFFSFPFSFAETFWIALQFSAGGGVMRMTSDTNA